MVSRKPAARLHATRPTGHFETWLYRRIVLDSEGSVGLEVTGISGGDGTMLDRTGGSVGRPQWSAVRRPVSDVGR
ncbi:MAG: hypothetical protein JWM85_3525 [Acidimicrobiaceae bacterium]|nr:hypothetical protein [Acidimicrobiaceae bacterium]